MLVLIMMITLATTSFAAANGSITIKNLDENTVYEIYRILDLESYNADAEAFSYKINEKWSVFFATDEAKAYVEIKDNYATWIEDEDDSTVAAFAKIALKYAKDHDIDPEKSSSVSGDMTKSVNPETEKTNGVFSGLELGWYLVDSDMGALCALTTTKPSADVDLKNGVPTMKKEVLEDSDESWGDENTSDIRQLVHFRVTVNAYNGAENYVIHDLMSDGFTFDKVTKVEHTASGSEPVTLTENTEYSVWTEEGITDAATDDTDDGCQLEIRFEKEFLDTLATDDEIVIYYQAYLNEGAVIAGDGNPNEAWLEYGDNRTTTPDITITYTYGFDIVKTDASDTLLDNAKFRIYNAATGGKEIKVVLTDDGTYRVTNDTENGVDIVTVNGTARVVGLDSDTYYLEETEAPSGYNKLTSRKMFEIENYNLLTEYDNGVIDTEKGVHVVNKTGTELPGTGGMGTTLFVGAGAVLMLIAAVTLFVKKRMSQIAE